MQDLLYLALTAALFAALFVYVRGLESLGRRTIVEERSDDR